MNVTEINAVIDTVCAKLEIPVQKGFEYLTVKGSMTIYWASVTTLLLIFALIATIWVRHFERAWNINHRCQDYTATVLVFLFSVIPALALLCFTWYDAILFYISPEAWCISYLMDKI